MSTTELRRELDVSTRRLRDLLIQVEHTLEEGGGDDSHVLLDRLRASLADGRRVLADLRAAAAQRAREADHVVRDNPYAAAGIAAAAGAAIGLVISRACSSWR